MPYMEYAKMLEFVKSNIDKGNEIDVLKADCNNIEFILDNCEMTIPKENVFFANVNCDGLQGAIIWERAAKFKKEIVKAGLDVGIETKAYTGIFDFSHTSAEWETVVAEGIYGIKERLEKYLAIAKDLKKQRFYSECLRVYNAALRFIKRAGGIAEKCGKNEMAKGLYNLCENRPGNLFEVMQTMIIFYILQHMVEGTYLRTLGRLDKLLYPYYVREERQYAKSMLHNFLKEIDRLKAPSNIPLAIGGTDENGHSMVNQLSYDILDAYHKVPTVNTKLHLLCSRNIPNDIVEKALIGIREGKNSIVFISDEKAIEALKKLGAKHEDAVNYHVVGCYECGAAGELTCSCNARVNIPKALEVALNKGKDMLTGKKVGLDNNGVFNTFEELYDEFERQLKYFTECAMKATDIYEQHYKEIHSAPILSATYLSAMEKGGDLYCDYAAKYNNSSLNAIGLATAVDSLAAIRKLVYEDKTVRLAELTEILKKNWEGNEKLRLTIKNKFPKFGVGNNHVDKLAKSIVETLSRNVNGKPNAKGGVYRLGTFSIDWRWEFGKFTAASADGRLHGEPLSQNTSATFGMDKEGATAHILSVTSFDSVNTPNGSIVDLDLHSSSVVGKNGLKALIATVKTYFERGGLAIHYNILDTETLKKAKKNPKDYPNLQVRLCGWNVLFSSLSDKEKDEFIARSVR